MSVLTTATRRHIPGDGILRCGNCRLHDSPTAGGGGRSAKGYVDHFLASFRPPFENHVISSVSTTRRSSSSQLCKVTWPEFSHMMRGYRAHSFYFKLVTIHKSVGGCLPCGSGLPSVDNTRIRGSRLDHGAIFISVDWKFSGKECFLWPLMMNRSMRVFFRSVAIFVTFLVILYVF
jgi:hypothetical protein